MGCGVAYGAFAMHTATIARAVRNDTTRAVSNFESNRSRSVFHTLTVQLCINASGILTEQVYSM